MGGRVHRRWHRDTGLVAAAVVLLVTVTGVLLHHPQVLGGKADGPALVAADPVRDGQVLRVSPFLLERSADGGITWSESPLALVPARPRRLAAGAGDRSLWLLGDAQLLVSTDGGMIWEERALPGPVFQAGDARDIAPTNAGEAVLLAASGAWRTDDGGATWTPLWEAGAGNAYALVHRLHTGHWATGAMPWIYDAAAVALVALTVTGLALAIPRRRRAPRNV
jgi:hypothetical protein